MSLYDIALTVQACLQAGTSVDAAWTTAGEAAAFTPGGGRVGSVLGGAFDDRLIGHSTARIIDLEVGAVEALISGIEAGTVARVVAGPADAFPADLWPALAARAPYVLHTEVDGVAVVTELRPSPLLVLAGGGDYGDSIAELAGWLGWQVERVSDPVTAEAKAATLGPGDAAIVVGHDYDTTGAVLRAALTRSRAGYVGALGAPKVRDLRRRWLDDRGITDLTRLHMPAGLDIGSHEPREVALSVCAELLAVVRAAGAGPLATAGLPSRSEAGNPPPHERC